MDKYECVSFEAAKRTEVVCVIAVTVTRRHHY